MGDLEIAEYVNGEWLVFDGDELVTRNPTHWRHQMNTNDLLADCPDIKLHSVGDCEMLERSNGAWITHANVRQLLEWVMDNDDRDVMFEKLLHLSARSL